MQIGIKNLKVLNPKGRIFFVAKVFAAYFDESYTDDLLMCVGGWLAHEDTWKRIESQWGGRVAYENKRSAKRGEPEIDRYHASDLDNFKDQFSRDKGWEEDRRTLFTKKLIDIIGRDRDKLRKPIGIATGIYLPDIREAFPSSGKEKFYKQHWAAYRVCMMQNMLTLADTMRRAFPCEQVAVIYDNGPYNSAALSAFDSFRAGKTKNKSDVVTIAPMCGKQCVALQPADMMAYESRKLIKSGVRQAAQFRRSLQRIIGNGIMIRVKIIGREALTQIAESRRLAPPSPDSLKEEL